MSRRTQITLGLALAALFVWLFLRQADLGEVMAALRAADPLLVVFAALMTIGTCLVRAWRWRMLLAPLGQFAMRPLFEATMVGFAVTIVLPGRIGEIARPVVLSRKTGVRVTPAFGTVVLERIFDAATVLALMAFYLLFLPAPTMLDAQGRMALDAMRTTGMAALAGLLVAGVLAVLGMRSRRLRLGLEERARRWLPAKLGELAVAFLEGLSGLGSPWLVLRIAAASLVLWGTILLIYVPLFWAFDLDIPWYAAFPTLVLLVLGVMVPTPGAVGSYHKAAQIGLVSLWAVDNEVAVAWAIVAHASTFLPLGIVGLAIMLRDGLRPSRLGQLAEEKERGGRAI